MNFAAILDRAGGRPAGFDYLRLFLAIAIIGFHSIVTCYGQVAQGRVLASGIGWIFNLILPMFFALSGFLVAGSLQRNTSVWRFSWLRIGRIYPALMFDTFLCAMLLGPMMSTLPLAEYFSAQMFLEYLLNALGYIHYYLPGVFEGNPISKVNAQLWTVPVELRCYVILAAMALLRLHKKPRWFGLACLIVALVAGGWLYASHPEFTARGFVPGHVLVLSFLGGVAIYLNKDIVPFSLTGLAAASALFIACVVEPRWVFFAALPAAYVAAYLGCLDVPRHRLIKKFDVSYGLFLYGYPVQQMIVAWFGGTLSWYANVLLALPITFVVAYFSLIVVERPSHRWLTNLSAPPWSAPRVFKTKHSRST